MRILADRVTRDEAGIYHAYVKVIDETSGSVYTAIQLDWNPQTETGAQFKARTAATLRPIITKIDDVETKRAQLQALFDTLDPHNL